MIKIDTDQTESYYKRNGVKGKYETKGFNVIINNKIFMVNDLFVTNKETGTTYRVELGSRLVDLDCDGTKLDDLPLMELTEYGEWVTVDDTN